MWFLYQTTAVCMPALIDTRLAYLRYMTRMHILDDPTPITLRRTVKVAVAGGGHDYPRTDIPAQNFRLANQTNYDGLEHSLNDDGEARKFTYTMLGEWDADVQINDLWEADGVQYSVEGMLPNNEFETRAVVTAFSKEPRHG